MFARNGSVARAVSGGANRAVGAMSGRVTGSGVRSGLYASGMRAAQYVANNPRRAMGGAAVGLGAMGLAGNGRRNNSPYQQQNPYA